MVSCDSLALPISDSPAQPLSDELANCLPTPLRRLRELESDGVELWLKDDGLSGLTYGGNKLRKLGPLLQRAKRSAKRRLVTVGAAGSHHVLATTLYGRREGFRVAALMFPQKASLHASDNLRTAVGLGLEVLPCGSARDALRSARRLVGAGDFWIGPGAMGPSGAVGFADAMHELMEQCRASSAPPEAIVVPVGSGSTAAGLLVGNEEVGLNARLIAVAVNHNPAVRPAIIQQALALAKLRDPSTSSWRLARSLNRKLSVDGRFVGSGYGHSTPDSEGARKCAAAYGLHLDTTYTAKAFASYLATARSGSFRRLLYWNTLSARSLRPLVARAPELSDLEPAVLGLLR